MFKFLINSFLVIALVFSTSIGHAETVKPSYDYLKSMTVYLVERKIDDPTKGAIGTGVIVKITEHVTYIMTNKHVCEWNEDSVCYVQVDDGSERMMKLIARADGDLDMQLAMILGTIEGKTAIKGVQESYPQDNVYMVGNNNGNPYMYSEGTVSGITRDGDLLVGMPSGPGNSGSGVFTQDGYLTGLLYAGQVFRVGIFPSLDNSHGICVKATDIAEFLKPYFG